MSDTTSPLFTGNNTPGPLITLPAGRVYSPGYVSAYADVDLGNKYHSADTDQNYRINYSELAEVINLYNTRFVDPSRALGAVRAATTSSTITLSGRQTIDGVALDLGDRVLVKNQTAPAENGVYVVSNFVWNRASDADTAAELALGWSVLVEEGTSNHDEVWYVSTAPTTLGPDPVVWTGSARTGCYKPDPLNPGRFVSAPERTLTESFSFTEFHSADVDRNGNIDLLELTRVIELYNFFQGTVRTGEYHVWTAAEGGTSEDGFAPGPAP